MLRACRWLSPAVRALVAKDIRLVLRDPVHWSQFLIFFGIAGLYFFNLRGLRYNVLDPRWNTMILIITFACLLLALASLNGRLVFPLFSLEGNRIWIIGSSLLSMQAVLLEKFWLWTVVHGALLAGLVSLAAWMTHVSTALLCCLLVLTGLACASLTGLAVGLGAMYLPLNTDSPMQITSGFGGTLTVVLGLSYVVIMVGAVSMLLGETGFLSDIFLLVRATKTAQVLAVMVAISLLYGALPLWLAFRKVERLEF